MSLSQLRYFVAVAEEGTLSKAAIRLHISQPPLTRHIRGLEQELHAQLFQRSAKGMHLLPTGERFLVHARRILDEVDLAISAVRQPSDSPPAESRTLMPNAHRSTVQ